MRCKVAMAKAVGKMHLEKGGACEDAVYAIQGKRVVAVALADGAGSKKYGKKGAETVVRDICEYLVENMQELLRSFSTAKQQICEFIQDTLRNLPEEYDELGSTLLFVAVSGKNCIFGHIGDGVILYREEGSAQILSLPENGDYANETFFTTDDNLMEHLQLHDGYTEGACDFMLMSDGCASLLVNAGTGEIAKNCDAILDWNITHSERQVEKDLTETLEKTFREMTGDDMSLALLHIFA